MTDQHQPFDLGSGVCGDGERSVRRGSVQVIAEFDGGVPVAGFGGEFDGGAGAHCRRAVDEVGDLVHVGEGDAHGPGGGGPASGKRPLMVGAKSASQSDLAWRNTINRFMSPRYLGGMIEYTSTSAESRRISSKDRSSPGGRTRLAATAPRDPGRQRPRRLAIRPAGRAVSGSSTPSPTGVHGVHPSAGGLPRLSRAAGSAAIWFGGCSTSCPTTTR